MFDGNHRTRRNINLSSATKRSSRPSRNRNSVPRGSISISNSSISSISSSKSNRGNASEILEEARKSREVRLLNLKQNKASVCIQRLWRGFSARNALVNSLLLNLDTLTASLSLTNQNSTARENIKVNVGDGSLIFETMFETMGLIWKTGTALLMPSLVSILTSRIHSTRIHSTNVSSVAQILLKIETSLRYFHDQQQQGISSNINNSNNRETNHYENSNCNNNNNIQSMPMLQIIQTLTVTSANASTTTNASTKSTTTNNVPINKTLSSILVCRRIFLHCLICLQSTLRSKEQLPDLGNQNRNRSILNLMNYMVLQNYHERNDYQPNHQSLCIQKIIPMMHGNNPSKSEIQILYTFTQCCQSYYHKLASLSSSPKSFSSSSSADITYQYVSHITSHLLKFACLSIPKTQETTSTALTTAATSTVAMKYLSAILLGIDLQTCFNASDVVVSGGGGGGGGGEHGDTLSPYVIFHQCAIYFFTNQGFTINPMAMDTESTNYVGGGSGIDHLEDQKLMVLLLKSLDAAMMNFNKNALAADYTQLISNLMSGNELMYTKNALFLLEFKNKKNSKSINNITSNQIMESEDDYKALCKTAIQLVASAMGIQRESNNKTITSSSSSSSSRQTEALNTLISLVAKGEAVNVQNLISTASKNNVDEDTDMDIDESFENHDDITTTSGKASVQIRNAQATSTSQIYTSNANRQKRQDLQTITKLDQIYQSKINRARQEVYTCLRNSGTFTAQTLLQVSNVIGNGDLMVEWALVMFPPPQIKKRKSMNEDNGDLIVEAMVTTSMDDLGSMRELFIAMLSKTLSYCTGIKSRACALSPILSKIAFQSNLMEQLWRYTKTSLECISAAKDQLLHSKLSIKAFSAASSFCDLFVHNLLAMDDEEFLASYTTVNTNGKPRSTIIATELIEVLKLHLHNLYWGKPVVVDDVALPSNIPMSSIYELESCQRARFILSGTKLWNALHQRWSRLYSTRTFCSQECWHFPRLVTRGHDEDGAMFDTRIEAAMNTSLDDDDDEDMMDFDDDENERVFNNVTVADEESDTLASSFKDPKMARILTSIPQAIPFDRRVKLFTSLLSADLARMQDETQAQRQMIRRMLDGEDGAQFDGRINAKIHRDKLYEDSMSQLNKYGTKLRKKVAVTFYNQVGALEAGIDGGGVFREFLDDLMKEAFNPEKKHEGQGPLFAVSPLQTLSVNTRIPPTPQILAHYQFVGRILGKAVYESLLVEPQFAYPFLNQLLGQQNTLDDLKNLDPEYYKHLSALRHMSSDEIDALGLTFELSTPSLDGKRVRTVELIPGGSSMSVTKRNAIRYVHLVAHRRLNIESSKQTNAFLSGFRDLIPAAWVRLFSPYELQRLIGGDDTVKGFDVAGLKAAMQYAGGYHPSQIFMQWFWEIIEEMTPEQQRKFLKFMTSCSRQPLLGFKSLTPLPCVQQIRISESEERSDSAQADLLMNDKDVRLPTSATCMNILKLPNYKSKELMRAKLLYAIESGSGFELS